MARIGVFLLTLLGLTVGCGSERETPGQHADAADATPGVIEVGTRARFPIEVWKWTLFAEVVATEILQADTPGAVRDVRLTVRVCREDGTDAGLATRVSRAYAGTEAEQSWYAPGIDPRPAWTGLVPAGGSVRVWFERLEYEPGKLCGGPGVDVQVVTRLVDARHVAFEVRNTVLDCIK